MAIYSITLSHSQRFWGGTVKAKTLSLGYLEVDGYVGEDHGDCRDGEKYTVHQGLWTGTLA